MSLLTQALELAITAHAGQTDEDGMPHIIHALEVMFGVKKIFETSEEKLDYTLEELMIAAVLHDTVEDTFVTLALIEVQFGKVVRDLVDGVTRRGLGKNETKEFYRDFIYRTKTNPGSRIIKLADLTHNYGRCFKIKKASWREKLMFKYFVALRVLNDTDQPTWEQASVSVQYDGSTPHYFIADPNGKKTEMTEEEFLKSKA
jgi:GTP diphosphokinase / guanosine-3',5'-bis(diphosphate) 3'-diphosphatase